mmetsp:Transcript_66362/g.191566  ORF Transcript_66362/g.191566 Transcript_66362/m.191566 type:complete len:307 (+) Transcript_66362:608-1528(+)
MRTALLARPSCSSFRASSASFCAQAKSRSNVSFIFSAVAGSSMATTPSHRRCNLMIVRASFERSIFSWIVNSGVIQKYCDSSRFLSSCSISAMNSCTRTSFSWSVSRSNTLEAPGTSSIFAHGWPCPSATMSKGLCCDSSDRHKAVISWAHVRSSPSTKPTTRPMPGSSILATPGHKRCSCITVRAWPAHSLSTSSFSSGARSRAIQVAFAFACSSSSTPTSEMKSSNRACFSLTVSKSNNLATSLLSSPAPSRPSMSVARRCSFTPGVPPIALSSRAKAARSSNFTFISFAVAGSSSPTTPSHKR